jgi:two-component system cell cycle response regulator
MEQQNDQDLKRQLDTLLAQVRENEGKLERLHALEIRLLTTADIRSLFELLIHDVPREFGIDAASLTVLDDDHELRRHFDREIDEPQPEVVLVSQDEAEIGLEHEPYMGDFEELIHGPLFPGVEALASVVILPLKRGDKRVGQLAYASTDPDRYSADAGMYFLDRLAVMAAISIENAVNLMRLEQFGITDPLTGIRNQRYFDQRLQEEVLAAQREQNPISFLFIDIDDFKPLNSSHGHRAGDDIIRAVASRMALPLRKFDVYARYGGDEFVVLLPEAGLEDATGVAERIRDQVSIKPVLLHNGQRVDVTVSVGVASCEHPEELPDVAEIGQMLMQRADQAMLLAHQEGPGRVVPYTRL